MRAATWSEEFDLIDTIDGDVLDALTGKGFGKIDRKAVLRNLSAAAGGGFSAESIDELRKRKVDELRDAAQLTVEGYKRAVDFLTAQIGVPNQSILPYSNQIVVLAELFRRLSRPSPEQYSQIKKWFWRTTLTGYFRGWNTGQMASDLKALEAFADGSSSEIALSEPKPTMEIWLTRQFRSNNAHAKMLALMLSQVHPRDLLTGMRIPLDKTLAWENSREFHHIFPKQFLVKAKAEPQTVNCLANCTLLTSSSNKGILSAKPSEYFFVAFEKLDNDFDDVLRSNLISDAALGAALNDDFPTFLRERAHTIHLYALQLCGWLDT